ncbi:hypothetical protein RDI58_023563 [Solanum bulbocastanum]|uniref:Uncharacterized protein n=1 Tax=Solanum bulbocastanum TaxID=147425 RepID=A0AAN8T4S9_SOLBU
MSVTHSAKKKCCVQNKTQKGDVSLGVFRNSSTLKTPSSNRLAAASSEKGHCLKLQ